MLRKSNFSIQPKRMKKVGIFLLFVNTFLLTLVFCMLAMTEHAQGYYGLTNSYYNYQPTTTNFTSNPYAYGTNSYYQPNSSSSSAATTYSQPSYYPDTSSYLTNYSASTPGSYYNGNGTLSNTYSPAYTTSSSFYNNPATTYGTTSGNYYTPPASTYGAANQTFYNPAASYTGSTGSFYTTPSTSNGGFYNTPTSTANPYTANSYYNNNTYYRTNASTTPYYPAASTYLPAATGYTINQATDASGLYQGNWARNYSSTGANTVGRTSNGGGMRSLYDIVRSSNSTSATAGTCGGGGNGNGGGLLPITLDLIQTAATVNGGVTFFDENNNAKTIPVNGAIENGTVLNLNGTTAGDISDPALYAIKITATLKTNALQGAYTLTNTVTNANIELGTFSANR